MTIVAAHYLPAAERRAEQISEHLDAIADNVDAVLPLIREAIEQRDHLTLGYRSVGDYVQDRFGGALTRLPRDLRQPVVHELHAAGMSTRAIAPVVGVSDITVRRDLTGATDVAPPVVGIDGKTYTRPEPRPAPPSDTEWSRERQAESERYAARENLRSVLLLTTSDVLAPEQLANQGRTREVLGEFDLERIEAAAAYLNVLAHVRRNHVHAAS